MKLAMNMLRQYVDIPVTPEEYSERMIMTGTAVEGVEDIADGMSKMDAIKAVARDRGVAKNVIYKQVL